MSTESEFSGEFPRPIETPTGELLQAKESEILDVPQHIIDLTEFSSDDFAMTGAVIYVIEGGDGSRTCFVTERDVDVLDNFCGGDVVTVIEVGVDQSGSEVDDDMRFARLYQSLTIHDKEDSAYLATWDAFNAHLLKEPSLLVCEEAKLPDAEGLLDEKEVDIVYINNKKTVVLSEVLQKTEFFHDTELLDNIESFLAYLEFVSFACVDTELVVPIHSRQIVDRLQVRPFDLNDAMESRLSSIAHFIRFAK